MININSMEELLTPQKRTVRITNTETIHLLEQTLFKADGDEGLHLWEASIVLSRFIVKNKEMFKDKKIIELGTGCGLIGLASLHFTDCSSFTFSDYQDNVLKNLEVNIKLNASHCNTTNITSIIEGRYTIEKIDWRDYANYNRQCYDYVLGSELVYSGGYIEELVKLIKNLLSPDGKALIAMPEKRMMTSTFLKFIEENGLKFKYSPMNDSYLLARILDDERQSNKLFENLENLNIILYEIARKD